jgi:hypothetical protein
VGKKKKRQIEGKSYNPNGDLDDPWIFEVNLKSSR